MSQPAQFRQSPPPPQQLPGLAVPQQPGQPIITIPPGAGMFSRLQGERTTTWQRQARSQGDVGMYNPSVRPDRPFSFELASYRAPSTMSLFLTEITVRIFTFGGVGATDAVELPPGALTTKLALDFTVGSRHPFNMENEITPTPIVAGTAVSRSAGPRSSTFAKARANATTNASGAGRALLPVDGGMPGSDEGPFCVYVDSDVSDFVARIFVFEPLPVPVNFFQIKLAGYTINQETGRKIMQQLNLLTEAKVVLSPRLPSSDATEPKSSGRLFLRTSPRSHRGGRPSGAHDSGDRKGHDVLSITGRGHRYDQRLGHGRLPAPDDARQGEPRGLRLPVHPCARPDA